MLFSELQKQLSPSPIKTWRLLKQLRDEGRMKEPDDFMMQDRKLYVNVPRFIVELESLGYANMKSDDFKSSDLKSDEIKKLADELRLISNEITESRIQQELISDDFIADEDKRKFENQDLPMQPRQQSLKSDEIKNSNLKSNDFTDLSREIIETKNELIDTLKGSVASKDEENKQLRQMLTDFSEHIKTLTQQNTYLSNLLVAPKAEAEPMRSAKVRVTDVTDDEEELHPDSGDDFSDFTDEITKDTDLHREEKTPHDNPGEAFHHANATEENDADEQEQSVN